MRDNFDPYSSYPVFESSGRTIVLSTDTDQRTEFNLGIEVEIKGVDGFMSVILPAKSQLSKLPESEKT